MALIKVMIASPLRPGASVCTAARWSLCARLKAKALGPRRNQKCDGGVRWSCKIYKRTISKSDGQTVRRSYGQTDIRTDGQRVRRSDGETARLSKNV